MAGAIDDCDDGDVCTDDSSAGEVRRPGLQGDPVDGGGEVKWEALAGISDRDDPLVLNFIVLGGHQHYLDFFCDVGKNSTNFIHVVDI